MIFDHGGIYKMSRREAAMRFIEAFMSMPEKGRDKLVESWNADVGGDGK